MLYFAKVKPSQIYAFLKKSSFVLENVQKAAESHRLLVKAYGEPILTVKTCEMWLRKLKNGDFDVQVKERSGSLETQNFRSYWMKPQTQKEMAEALNMVQEMISNEDNLKSGKIGATSIE